MRKGTLAILITLLVAIALLTNMQVAAAAQTPIKWRVQSTYPPKSHASIKLGWWAQEVGKRSNGRIDIQILSVDTLFRTREAFDAVSDRVAEGSLCALWHSAGKLPEGDISGAPFIWNSEEYVKIWTQTNYMDVLNKAMGKFNVRDVGLIASGLFPLLADFPVYKIEDLKGKRINSTGIAAEFLKSLGAAAMNITPAELYMALSRKTLDGVFFPVYTLESYKYWEVVKYVTMLGLHDNVEVDIFVNLNAWNELPKDIQEIILQVGKQLIVESLAEAEVRNKAILEESKKRGLQIIYPSKDLVNVFHDKAKPFWEKVASKSATCRELVDIIYKVRGIK